MADQHQQNEVNDPRPAEQAQLGKRGLARRRLGKAGIGAVGVLWSLESKATNFACHAPSGFYSTNLQAKKTAMPGGKHLSASGPKATCQGWPPSVWCAIGSYWPCSDKIKFDSVFKCTTWSSWAIYGNVSMLDILQGKCSDPDGLGAQLVAAYLNVLSKKISVVDEADLIDMWRQIQVGGYKISSTMIMTRSELSAYLNSTNY